VCEEWSIQEADGWGAYVAYPPSGLLNSASTYFISDISIANRGGDILRKHAGDLLPHTNRRSSHAG